MQYYVGLDVSLKQTSICVVDQMGLVVREGVVDFDPDARSSRSLTSARPGPTRGEALAQAKVNFSPNAKSPNAKRGAGRPFPRRPGGPVQEFCMTCIPYAPISPPVNRWDSGQPSPDLEPQPRHGKSGNPDNVG